MRVYACLIQLGVSECFNGVRHMLVTNLVYEVTSFQVDVISHVINLSNTWQLVFQVV